MDILLFMSNRRNNIPTDELTTLFNITIEDIERMKQQQWRIFYSTIVLQGGLFYISKKCCDLYIIIFIILMILICFYSTKYMNESQDSIIKFRIRKNKQLRYFHKELKDTFERDDDQSDIDKKLIMTVKISSLLLVLYYLIELVSFFVKRGFFICRS